MPRAIGQPLEISPLAGRLGPKRMLVDMARLELECYSCRPDLGDPNQLLSFGRSGHGGLPARASVALDLSAATGRARFAIPLPS
jgi:hypothetical protein